MCVSWVRAEVADGGEVCVDDADLTTVDDGTPETGAEVTTTGGAAVTFPPLRPGRAAGARTDAGAVLWRAVGSPTDVATVDDFLAFGAVASNAPASARQRAVAVRSADGALTDAVETAGAATDTTTGAETGGGACRPCLVVAVGIVLVDDVVVVVVAVEAATNATTGSETGRTTGGETGTETGTGTSLPGRR